MAAETASSDIVRATHSSGSSVDIHRHGATVTSFRTAAGKEMLFVSNSAVFDRVKPIRGGIPLIFPQFGDSGPLVSHGFARRSAWDVNVTGDGIVVAVLRESEETLSVWKHAFELTYTVEFDANSLRTTLAVRNTGDKAFDFQALLHTYHAVPHGRDITDAHVSGLAGATYIDKLQSGREVAEADDPVLIAAETDRIYKEVDGGVRLSFEGDTDSSESVLVERGARSGGADVASDVVLWNPWIDKAARMGDFGDNEWHSMLCIEPGHVSSFRTLDAAATYELWQRISTPAASKPDATAAGSGSAAL